VERRGEGSILFVEGIVAPLEIEVLEAVKGKGRGKGTENWTKRKERRSTFPNF